MSKIGTCTCSKCGHTFVPSFSFDFYPKPTEKDPNAGLCENCFMREAFSKQTVSSAAPVSIPDGYDEVVCMRGKGEVTCSFLGAGGSGFVCLKRSSMEAAIKAKLHDGSMGAKGDNCSGPPHFLKK